MTYYAVSPCYRKEAEDKVFYEYYCKNWDGKGFVEQHMNELRKCKRDPDTCPFFVKAKKV